MLRLHNYLLGFALTLLTITPVAAVGGIRVGYALILLLATWRLFALDSKIPKSAFSILLWLIPLCYALSIDSIRGGAEGISLFARGTLTLLAAFLVLAGCRDDNAMRRIAFGAVPLVTANSIVAILQYFGFTAAFVVGAMVAGSEGEEMAREVMSIGNLRPSGVQGAAHVFAYIMGVWAFTFAWVAVRARGWSAANAALSVVTIIAVCAVVLSAQRSVVWIIVPCLLVLLYLRFGSALRALPIAGGVALVVFVLGSAEIFSESGIVTRVVSFTGTSGDMERQQTWQQAWLIISEDPYFGRAFGAYDFGRGIHNAFLNGWARYGILWLTLVVVGLGAYLFGILRERGNLLDQFGGVVLFLLVLANAMFHTTGPVLGDMIVFIAFAFGLTHSGVRITRRNLPNV